MFTPRLLDLLVVALSTISAAQGILIDPAFRVPHVPHNGHAIAKRAGTTGGPDDSVTLPSASNLVPTTPTPVVTPSSSPQVTTPTPSSSPSPSETPSPSPSSSEPIDTTPTPSPSPSANTTPSPSQTPISTSQPPKETKTDTASQSSITPVTATSTEVVVVTTTNAQGQTTTSAYTTEHVSTSTPGLASPQTSGQTGMSNQTRNTVIGVVVGVGGAAILAGIAFLFFRLHRKKQPEEGDGLMEYDTGYPAAEKKSDVGSTSPNAGRSPFQSTLETYHAPTQVNTASNF